MFYVKAGINVLIKCASLAEVQKVADELNEEFVEILIKNA